MSYPFELEWLEGGSLDQVQRILAHQPLYARPTPDYVAFNYAPLYYYVAALPAAVLGAGFLPLRLVSFLSSLVVLGLVFSIVKRETGRTLPALLASGAFAGTYSAAGCWLDVARVDSLYLALLLAAVHRIRFGRSMSSRAVAGAILCLAFLTKQAAVIAILGFALHDLAWRRRHLPAFIATAGLGILASTLLMDRLTDGWYAFHVLGPNHLLWRNPLLWPHFVSFWLRDLPTEMPIALLGALIVLALGRDDLERTRFYATFTAVMLGTGLLSRMVTGAWSNALLPAYAGLSVLFGLGFDVARSLLPPSASERRAGLETALLGSAVLQLALLAWDPRTRVPSAQDRQAGERLTARLQHLGDRVVVASHPYLAARATGHGHAHSMAISYLRPGPVAEDLDRLVRQSLCERRYSAVVTNGSWRYQRELERYYGPGRELTELGNAFWPVVGVRTRPTMLYARPAATLGAQPGGGCGPAPARPDRSRGSRSSLLFGWRRRLQA
jgi:hypothetical protein